MNTALVNALTFASLGFVMGVFLVQGIFLLTQADFRDMLWKRLQKRLGTKEKIENRPLNWERRYIRDGVIYILLSIVFFLILVLKLPH